MVSESRQTTGLDLFAPTSSRPARVEGDLTAANVGSFREFLLALAPNPHGEAILDLLALEIDSGEAMAEGVTAIRELASRTSRLVLLGAPQMLCHNLYRIGLLDGNITLAEMRQNEPSAF
jgi:hypothetical protein